MRCSELSTDCIDPGNTNVKHLDHFYICYTRYRRDEYSTEYNNILIHLLYDAFYLPHQRLKFEKRPCPSVCLSIQLLALSWIGFQVTFPPNHFSTLQNGPGHLVKNMISRIF